MVLPDSIPSHFVLVCAGACVRARACASVRVQAVCACLQEIDRLGDERVQWPAIAPQRNAMLPVQQVRV